MTTTEPAIDVRDMVDPHRYARGYPHDVWTALRRHSPVHWCEIDGFRPFWAITRHADIKHVSTHPGLFSSTDRLIVLPSKAEPPPDVAAESPKLLLTTDPPE